MRAEKPFMAFNMASADGGRNSREDSVGVFTLPDGVLGAPTRGVGGATRSARGGRMGAVDGATGMDARDVVQKWSYDV